MWSYSRSPALHTSIGEARRKRWCGHINHLLSFDGACATHEYNRRYIRLEWTPEGAITRKIHTKPHF